MGDFRGALSPVAGGATAATVARELAGSPAPLAALHRQASEVLAGDQRALDARITGLRGYPIVVNVWASWCEPCQAEFRLFARASAEFGKRIAFLGSDTNEPSPTDGQQFLDQHHVSYPSELRDDTPIDAGAAAGRPGGVTDDDLHRAGRPPNAHEPRPVRVPGRTRRQHQDVCPRWLSQPRGWPFQPRPHTALDIDGVLEANRMRSVGRP